MNSERVNRGMCGEGHTYQGFLGCKGANMHQRVAANIQEAQVRPLFILMGWLGIRRMRLEYAQCWLPVHVCYLTWWVECPGRFSAMHRQILVFFSSLNRGIFYIYSPTMISSFPELLNSNWFICNSQVRSAIREKQTNMTFSFKHW